MQKKLTAYTDGSANWKNGLGGSACVFENNGNPIVYNKGLKNTKTGRSEIHALLIALNKAPKNVFLTVFSDSMYVVGAISKGWLKNWQSVNFIGLKNADLWIKVKSELDKFKDAGGVVVLKHVKGHSGNIFNELADHYANYKNFAENDLEDDFFE